MKYLVKEHISQTQYEFLLKILEGPSQCSGDLFLDEPTSDGQVEILTHFNLIAIDEHDNLFVTELGRAALKEYECELERQQLLEKQRNEEISALKLIADSAQTQAKIAEESAQKAINDAISAKRDALFAKIVSVLAVFAPILYDFITAKLPILLGLFLKQ